MTPMSSIQISPTGIRIEKPDEKKLADLGVKDWPIWTKEPSGFDWYYEEVEICYILEGEATIETKNGNVQIGPGDLVTFPNGLDCVWKINKTIRKHYTFE